MNKQEAVEIMGTFLHSNNVEKAKARGILDAEGISMIESETMKDTFRVTSGILYDVMDEQGLIVKD
jgi:hypothetical protein